VHEKDQVIKNFATLGNTGSSSTSSGRRDCGARWRLRGKHFCKQLAKNVLLSASNSQKMQ